MKRANKARLAAYVARAVGVKLDPASLFDVQVKRIHEYKRQLLNLLHVVTRYRAILADPTADWARQLATLSQSVRAHLLAHPAVVPLALQQPGLGPNGLRLDEVTAPRPGFERRARPVIERLLSILTAP